uniref:Uncharacterized protein n=1 Tax=Nothoprocta perdicaria TaxID=30464 RepID=A0A8C6ZAH1_NOTPE
MPEGPSVKKFQLLTSPFVGQVVTKVGGSSRKINVNELKALRLQDSQVGYKRGYISKCIMGLLPWAHPVLAL